MSKGLNMKKVVILGSGGHAKVIADIVNKSGDKIVGFLDNNVKCGQTFLGYPILGSDLDYVRFKDCYFVIAIGNSKVREKIYKKMKNVNWYTAIHPNASISSIGVEIGIGTVVMSNAVVNTDAVIGKHCIINSSSTVEHDNIIDDFVHISVGVKLAGHVLIGKHTWLGIGATVRNDISICDDCVIGAGAVVVKNIIESGTYIGVPAKLMNG